MRDMLQLYDEVFKELPFSITGYNSIEEKLYSFYNKFSDSNFIKYNPNFTFLCGAILKLNSDDKKSHIKWNVAGYDKFYFKSFQKVDKRAVVSVYFCLLSKLGEEIGGAPLRPSLIFAKLFREDLDFKLSLFDGKKPFIDYAKDKQLFEIKLPRSIFKEEIRKESYHSRINLIKKFERHKASEYLLQNPDSDHPRYYSSYDQCQKGDLFENFINNLIDENEIERVKGFLEEHLKHFGNIFAQPSERSDTIFGKFASCCVALGFWCLHYDSAVEYMMSVAKIKWQKNDENKWIKEKRNLGGLIVGYKKDYRLTVEERAILNLTSDRLTSVAAGQMLLEENKELSHEVNREKLKNILSEFVAIFSENAGHGYIPIQEEKKQEVEEFINRNQKWLGGDFGEAFNYLCEKNENYICQYWLTKLTSSTDIHSRSNVNDVDCLFKTTIDGQLTGEFSSNRINVPFIHSLFRELTVGHKKTDVISKSFAKDGTEIKCKVTYDPHFYYDDFINALKNPEKAGSLVKTYFIEFYDLLMAHGNFLIEHDGNTLFDVEKYIEDVNNNGIALYDEIIDEIANKEIDNEGLTTLDLIFVNKLEEE